jgi:integrase/recombinase XerD
MTHTFAATPARSRTLPRASRARHSKNALTNTYSERIQITAAMLLREAGVDISTIALWMGHESIASTQIYLHADLALKQRALDRTTPPGTAPARYKPPDPLLAFLQSL